LLIIKIGIKKRNELRDEKVEVANRHEIPSPILMSGTSIINGEGLFMALVVGPQSCEGKIESKLMSQDSLEAFTPL